MDQTRLRTENWEGTWLTDLDNIVVIDKDNKILKLNDSTFYGPAIFVDSTGYSHYCGKLIHRQRDEEDLRKKWNR